MFKTQFIEKDGVKYEVVRVVEETKRVVIAGLGDVTDYEQWYDYKKCLEAVKRNGYALQYVKEQSKDICLEAVKQDGYALRYVNKKIFIKTKEVVQGNSSTP